MSRKGGNGSAPEPEAVDVEPTGLDVVPEEPATLEPLEAMRAERDDLKEQLLRRRADFENYKKRVERDRHQASIDATAEVLKALIPTLDNFDRATAHADKSENLKEGIELTRRNMLAALEGLGLEIDDPLGQRYDPEVHEALSHEEVEGAPDNTIVEVFRKGYRYKERLLRPALVKVSKGESDEDEGKR